MHTLSKHTHFPLSWRLGDQGLSIDSMKGGTGRDWVGFGLWLGFVPAPYSSSHSLLFSGNTAFSLSCFRARLSSSCPPCNQIATQTPAALKGSWAWAHLLPSLNPGATPPPAYPSLPPSIPLPASPVSALFPLPLHKLCSLPGAASFYLVLLATTCFPFKTKLLHHFMIVCSFISSLIYSTEMCLALSLMLEKWRHLKVYVYWTRKTLSQQYEPFESIGSNFLKLSVPDPCPISSWLSSLSISSHTSPTLPTLTSVIAIKTLLKSLIYFSYLSHKPWFQVPDRC